MTTFEDTSKLLKKINMQVSLEKKSFISNKKTKFNQSNSLTSNNFIGQCYMYFCIIILQIRNYEYLLTKYSFSFV